jgi:hypothetical protein
MDRRQQEGEAHQHVGDGRHDIVSAAGQNATEARWGIQAVPSD